MTRLSTQIQNGVIGGTGWQFFTARLNEAVPAGWFVCANIMAIPDVAAGDGRIILHASATSPSGYPVGAKIRVDQTSEVEAASAELAHELGCAIARWVAEYGAPSPCIRFSLVENGRAPTRGTEGASGYDLYASQSFRFQPGQIAVVEVGVVVEIPRGLEGQVRPRSSMSKRGLWASTGTIDSDYRGIVGATIANLTREDQRVDIGDRVAQLVIAPVDHRPWLLVEREQLSPTARGDRGFGSTGK